MPNTCLKVAKKKEEGEEEEENIYVYAIQEVSLCFKYSDFPKN